MTEEKKPEQRWQSLRKENIKIPDHRKTRDQPPEKRKTDCKFDESDKHLPEVYILILIVVHTFPFWKKIEPERENASVLISVFRACRTAARILYEGLGREYGDRQRAELEVLRIFHRFSFPGIPSLDFWHHALYNMRGVIESSFQNGS